MYLSSGKNQVVRSFDNRWRQCRGRFHFRQRSLEYYRVRGHFPIRIRNSLKFFCNRGDTILRHGGLHTDLNQCNQGIQANQITSYVHHSSTTIDAQWFPKRKKVTLSFFAFFFLGVGGFQKSYVIFRGGISKYLLFLTGVGGWSGKGQKHPYVI